MTTSKGDISKMSFGRTGDGTPVDIYTLRNANGVEARITNYGGILASWKVPDRQGKLGDVVLGCDTLEGYLKGTAYFGCIVGRCANRIAKGRFTLNGVARQLAVNNGPNSLHGGLRGFDKVVWQAAPSATPDGPALELSYLSKDGEEGYPGNLHVKALHTLTRDNGVRIEFTASTDQDTVVNLTNHSYFNLAGKGDVLGHSVQINGDQITPVDGTLIPTGELRPVEGTPFDFRRPALIGARIEDNDEQLRFGGGYDHNWVLGKPLNKLGVMARVAEPASGRVLEVLGTQPGVQFYTGNFLDGTIRGKGGWVYQRREGFCLEPQHFPDAVNHPNFPTTVLRAGGTYRQTIIFRFSTEK
ncbi:MAG: aldose epimerase family protein [Verrucomicrobiota bacterium]|jgi:aldose 1-epimerase